MFNVIVFYHVTFSECNSPLSAMAWQPTTGLRSSCPQTENNSNHLASSGVMYDEHVDRLLFLTFRPELPPQISSQPNFSPDGDRTNDESRSSCSKHALNRVTTFPGRPNLTVSFAKSKYRASAPKDSFNKNATIITLSYRF